MTKRTTIYQGKRIPDADSVTSYYCGDGECGRAHIVLLDDNEQPIAQAVLAPDQLNDIADQAVEACETGKPLLDALIAERKPNRKRRKLTDAQVKAEVKTLVDRSDKLFESIIMRERDDPNGYAEGMILNLYINCIHFLAHTGETVEDLVTKAREHAEYQIEYDRKDAKKRGTKK
jgi:hypothetical protein